ncbi:MAG TPA: hypothetical protein PL195_08140 [bacterium]|nr:hypothetical protein [bacterium]
MTIPDRDPKIEKIKEVISSKISEINRLYRGGPSSYFYHRIIDLRKQNHSVYDFIFSDTCVEILYATLTAWDMDSRGAKMKDFNDFKGNLKENIDKFKKVEVLSKEFTWKNRDKVISALSNLYEHTALMKTNGRLVSNSKALHFIFPDLCPPMDRSNTINWLYNESISESPKRFLEILNFTYDVLNKINNPKQYLEKNGWNSSLTKLVDNAIIIVRKENED